MCSGNVGQMWVGGRRGLVLGPLWLPSEAGEAEDRDPGSDVRVCGGVPRDPLAFFIGGVQRRCRLIRAYLTFYIQLQLRLFTTLFSVFCIRFSCLHVSMRLPGPDPSTLSCARRKLHLLTLDVKQLDAKSVFLGTEQPSEQGI